MAAGGTFGEFLKDQLRSLGDVTVRRMFGGAGVWCDGVMFGLVSDDTLYFRVDDANRGAFAAEGLSASTLSAPKLGQVEDLETSKTILSAHRWTLAITLEKARLGTLAHPCNDMCTRKVVVLA